MSTGLLASLCRTEISSALPLVMSSMLHLSDLSPEYLLVLTKKKKKKKPQTPQHFIEDLKRAIPIYFFFFFYYSHITYPKFCSPNYSKFTEYNNYSLIFFTYSFIYSFIFLSSLSMLNNLNSSKCFFFFEGILQSN